MKESLRLYRELLKAARSFPVAPVARKLESNIKEVSQAFVDEKDVDKVCALHEDGYAALRVIAFLRGLPEVSLINNLNRLNVIVCPLLKTLVQGKHPVILSTGWSASRCLNRNKSMMEAAFVVINWLGVCKQDSTHR